MRYAVHLMDIGLALQITYVLTAVGYFLIGGSLIRLRKHVAPESVAVILGGIFILRSISIIGGMALPSSGVAAYLIAAVQIMSAALVCTAAWKLVELALHAKKRDGNGH